MTEFTDKDFHKLFDQAPLGLAVCEMSGKLILVNQAFADIIGRTTDETLRLEYWNITPRQFEDEEALRIKELKENGRYGPYEKYFIHKDRSLVPVRLNGVIVELNGESCIWSTVERLELPIYSSTLLREAPAGLALCELDGRFVAVNPAFADIIGRTVEETLKLRYGQITPKKYESAEKKQVEELKRSGRYGPYAKEYLHKNGHMVRVQLIGKILRINGKDFIWSIVVEDEKRPRRRTIRGGAIEDLNQPITITELEVDLLYTETDIKPIRPPSDEAAPKKEDEPPASEPR